LCEKYNQAIEQLKTKCKTVDRKIEEQEEKYEFKINELEKALGQKDKIIKKLKEQLK
jgi:flagellar capping protein FliD